MEIKQSPIRVMERMMKKPRLEVKIPEIKGLEDKEIQRETNDRIRQVVFKLIREQGYKEDVTKKVVGDYQIKVQKNNILSILLTNYACAQGGDHGLTMIEGVNLEIGTGKLYHFEELFHKNNTYEEEMGKIVREHIQEKKIALINEFEKIPKQQGFYLTQKDLVLYYQIYDYTTYSDGTLEISIPYQRINNLINLHGPIGRIIE